MSRSARKNFKYTDELLFDGSAIALTIAEAVRAVARDVGHRPSHADLRDYDHGPIAAKLNASQIRQICAPLNLPEPEASVIWTKARREEAVRDVWVEIDQRPTHQDLRDHGYHRAATILTAADIDRVGLTYGLAANRERKPIRFWTPEAVIEVYLEKFKDFE